MPSSKGLGHGSLHPVRFVDGVFAVDGDCASVRGAARRPPKRGRDAARRRHSLRAEHHCGACRRSAPANRACSSPGSCTLTTILELCRADFPDPLGRHQLVGVGRAGRIEVGLLIEAERLDHQRIAVPPSERMAIVERKCDELLVFRRRLVERDHADLVIELVDDRDLAGWRLEDLERIGGRQISDRPIRRAELARVIGDRAVLEAGHVLFIGFLALGRERQLAATDELDLGVVLAWPSTCRTCPALCFARRPALPGSRPRKWPPRLDSNKGDCSDRP